MEKTSTTKKKPSSEASDCGSFRSFDFTVDIRPEASNPIIFSRTETTHIPQQLLHVSQHKKLRDAIYSAKEDGTLKLSPLVSIQESENEEEPEEKELAQPKKIGVAFWKFDKY